VGQRCAFECLPVCLGGEGIEVLVRASIQSYIRGSDHSPKIAERFFIDLVILEELRVIAKIPKKGIEFPEGSLCAI
jgi:hypothetical protein